MPLATPALKAELAVAFINAMKVYREFDQTGNAGTDKFDAATTAAGQVFGDEASVAIDVFVKSGLVQTVTPAGPGVGTVT